MARRYKLGGPALSKGLLLATTLGLSCSGSPPRDINFGTDAGAGFEIPVRDTGSDTAASDVTGSAGGTGGAGQGGAGGQGGTGGTDIDASAD